MLEDDGFQFVRALDEGVQLGRVAMPRDPQFDADHRAVRDAAFEFSQAFLWIVTAQINEAEQAVGELRQHAEHLIILPAQVIRRRVLTPWVAHIEAAALDVHAVGGTQELLDPGDGRKSTRGGEVAVQVPNAIRRGQGADE